MTQYVTEQINQRNNAANNVNIWGNIFYNIKAFGAKGDGETDDTAAINAAIAAIPTGEFGVVYAPPGRYVSAPFTLPKFVTLKGASEGLWGSVGIPSPAYPPVYGTDIPANQSLFIVTNTVSPFITVNTGSTVEGVAFLYPNQVAPTALAPSVYPATIQGNYGAVDVTIRNIMFYNSYRGIDLDGCDRHHIEWVFGDPLLEGIRINRCHDASRIANIHFHDFMYATGSNMGAWKLANGFGVRIKRSDAQMLNNIFVWKRNIGLLLDVDSVEGASFGTGSDLHFDGCTYSMQILGTQSQAGWDFSNCQISANGILIQTANLVKVGFTNSRFWASGAVSALVTSNTHTDTIIRMTACEIAGGFTTSPIRAIAGATGRLLLNNVVFEDNGAGISVFELDSTLTEFLYLGGSIGNNSITIPSGITRRKVENVMGYNPQGLLVDAPAVPASGGTETNTYPFRVMVIVSPVSSLAKNGSNMNGVDRGTVILDPGETISITYASPPAWTWWGL